MWKYRFLLFFMGSYLAGFSQDTHHKHQDLDSIEHGSFNPNQAQNFGEWFKMGETSGMLRSSSMVTMNEGALSDHAALAVGGRLYFHTAYWKGLQLGLGGLYIYNLASTDLAAHDPTVNRLPRFERQLFDMADPHNRSDLDRLEELFVKYRYKDSYIRYGKMAINTPLVNAQDSRMKPTVLNGFWFDWNEGHQFEINGGWFSNASPRATTEWYTLGEAIGIYGRGLNPDGSISEYKEHIQTDGLLIIGGHVKSADEVLKVHLWQYHLTNVMRTSFFQLDYLFNHMDFGLQYILQNKSGNGGNEDYSRRYFHSDAPSHLFAGKWEYDKGHMKFSVNGAYGLGDGRFVFPRELGTANIFTFISRHRIEGQTDFTTHTVKVNYFPLSDRTLDLGLYFAHTESSLDPAKNKYGIPSMNQLNVDIKYHFEGVLSGLDLRMLGVIMSSRPLEIDPEFIYNKTNLTHLNFMTTYKF